MKKLLSLSLMLSLGLATVTPALNAAQSQAVAQSQKNPAHASGWQAAKKWWRSGRNMKALNAQEQRAFRNLRTKFTIGAIIAMIGGGAALAIGYKKRQAGQEAPTYVDAPPSARPTPRATEPVVAPVVAGHLGLELKKAIFRGNNEKVERLITAGADVNAADAQGFTPLIVAAYRGNLAAVEQLLAAGADVNAAIHITGYTPLMYAASSGYLAIVERLLPYASDEDKAEAIRDAREEGYTDIAKIIEDFRSGETTKAARQK